MSTMEKERVVVVGASRGLGAALIENLASLGVVHFLALSRKEDLLKNLQSRLPSPPSFRYRRTDLSREPVSEWIQEVRTFSPTRIFYTAGAGVHGPFCQKAWKAHDWTLRVTGLVPMEMVHALATAPQSSLMQVILVGSAIAENEPDPLASSYAAAKHLLRGFVTSVRAEESLPFDLRLYSPGYMDTELLPKNAWPRQQEGLVLSARQVAQDLAQWSLQADASGYRSYK